MFSIRTIASLALSVALAIGAGTSLAPEMGELSANLAKEARVSLEASAQVISSVLADSRSEFSTWVGLKSQTVAASEAGVDDSASSAIDGALEVEAYSKQETSVSLLPVLGNLGVRADGRAEADGGFGLNLR